MDKATLALLSNQFRTYCGSLSPFALGTLERTMQYGFGVKNLRNVQLWTRDGSVTRNILNSSISGKELDSRLAFVQGLLETRTPTFPTKIKELDNYDMQNGLKLAEYLSSPYIRSALARILINPDGTIALEYDVYGEGFADDFLDEDELDEFL